MEEGWPRSSQLFPLGAENVSFFRVEEWLRGLFPEILPSRARAAPSPTAGAQGGLLKTATCLDQTRYKPAPKPPTPPHLRLSHPWGHSQT